MAPKTSTSEKATGTVVELHYEETGYLKDDVWPFFFPCIAERARDIVGQLLEIRHEMKP